VCACVSVIKEAFAAVQMVFLFERESACVREREWMRECVCVCACVYVTKEALDAAQKLFVFE